MRSLRIVFNACPTYRELGRRDGFPRGRIYEMNQVANGAPTNGCLCTAPRSVSCLPGPRNCLPIRGAVLETPHRGRKSGDQRNALRPSWKARLGEKIISRNLPPSRSALQFAGARCLRTRRAACRKSSSHRRSLNCLGGWPISKCSHLSAEIPFFYSKIGKTFPAVGPNVT